MHVGVIMNKLIYLKLELKRMLKLIPYLAAGAIALSLVIGAVAFCAMKMLAASNRIDEKKTITFSSADDSDITEIVVSALSKSKSITALFNIIEADYQDVAAMAENDEAVVSVVIPEKFMYSLMHGANYPIELYFSKTTSIYSLLITELSCAAQTSLKAAQAGVYTLYDYYVSQDESDSVSDANEKLNFIYLQKALLRENMFSKTTLSATGSLDLKTYYISSGIMVITLLLGCVFILRTKETTPFISVKLKQHGISFIRQTLVRIFCIFTSLYVIFAVVLLIACLTNQFTNSGQTFHLSVMLLNGLAVYLCSAAIITCIDSAVRSRFSAILFLFISVIACSFISGAFIPSVFLPETLTVIGNYLPTTYLLNITGMILKGELYKKGLLILFCYFTGFTILSILFTHNSLKDSRSNRRHTK